MSTYQIAKYADGVGALKDITAVTGVDPHPTDYLEYTEVVGMSLIGAPIEVGFPRARWRWGMLEQWAFDALCSYCTGTSAPVYIRTRTNVGVPYTFQTFRATMARPRAKTRPGRLREDVEVEFTMLQSP